MGDVVKFKMNLKWRGWGRKFHRVPLRNGGRKGCEGVWERTMKVVRGKNEGPHRQGHRLAEKGHLGCEVTTGK